MAQKRKLSLERKEFINGLFLDLLGDTLQGMLEAEMDEKLKTRVFQV